MYFTIYLSNVKIMNAVPLDEFEIYRLKSFDLRVFWDNRYVYALYVEELTAPPAPVQLVWINSPRGLSRRS
jgi:hypothetical protein